MAVIRIDASDVNAGHVMEMTDEYRVDKKTALTVQDGYSAFILTSTGKLLGKVGACQKKRICKLVGKDADGRNIKVLFVNRRPFAEMSWGIGNLTMQYTPDVRSIDVKIGASGTFLAAMSDPVEFYSQFGRESGAVDLPEVTACLTSGFRKYASDVLLELYKEAEEPIIDAEFILDETDLRMEERLCNTKLDRIPGIVFKRIRVGNINIREADIEALREFYKSKRVKKSLK